MKDLHNNEALDKLYKILESYVTQRTIPSLSVLLKEPVHHYLKEIKEIGTSDIEELISSLNEESVMAAAYVRGEGDFQIRVLVYLPEKESKNLASKLLGQNVLDELDALGKSSISEIGNMLSASIFNAISHKTGSKISSTVPGFAIDTVRTLFEGVTVEATNESPSLILASFDLKATKSSLVISLLIILDPSEATKILLKERV
jgi:chemotaxis protein CheC